VAIRSLLGSAAAHKTGRVADKTTSVPYRGDGRGTPPAACPSGRWSCRHPRPPFGWYLRPVSGTRFVLLVFAGGLWDGQELTSLDPPPEWISIGASGRYTRINRVAAAPNGEGRSTAYYVWAHKDAAISTSDD
jgi:hypothetical protein